MSPADPIIEGSLPAPSDARETLRHPEVRNYLVAALAGLVFVFGILFGRGSDLGAVLTALFGLAGVFLRWTAAPPFVVLLTTYFLLFPTGLPFYGTNRTYDLRRGSFRIEDVILATALVVYVGSQYRLFGILGQAIPPEGRRSLKSVIHRRPAASIPTAEVVNLLWTAVAVVALGQLVWAVIAAVRIDAARAFPFVLADTQSYRGPDVPGRLSPSNSRFVLLVGMAFAAAVVANLTFWYWRLRLLKRDEARMILQDTEWDENRRELARLEGWRAWVTQRAAARARRTIRKPGRGRL